jgi:hypothetical protein
MKKIVGALITIIALASISLAAVAAPAGQWVTDFTLFNMDPTNAASVSLVRYNQFTGTTDLGTVVTTASIGANGSFYYNPANDSSFPSPFVGSMVVNSTAQLAGTVTIANTYNDSRYASDAYSAVTNPSTSVFLPIVMARLGANNWNTRITIQSAGLSTPITATIQFIGSGAPTPVSIQNLPPNMMAMVDQYDSGVTGFNGSARVTADGPVAIVVEEYKANGNVLIAYNGIPVAKASTNLYMPGYIDQAPWATDFTVVNTVNATGTFTVTFANNAAVIQCPLAANGSVYLNRYGGVPGGCTGAFPPSYYGSAAITSNVNAVVAYNIANSGTGGAGNQQMGYVGFSPTDGATSVVVPLIENRYGAGQWVTTYSVQVLDGSTANLTLTYSGNKAQTCPAPCNVSVIGAHTFNQPADGHVPVGFIGGVAITSDKPIVAIGDQGYGGTGAIAGGDVAAGFVGFGR